MTSIGHTFDGSLVLRDARRRLRRHLPAIAAVTAPISVLAERETLSSRFGSEAWDIGAFYSAVFDWSSIQSAFLFGIYAFILARSEPFIKAIDGTEPFEKLRSLCRSTLYMTFLLTLVSMPLAVTQPQPTNSLLSLNLWVLAGLSSLAAFSFFRFFKIVRVFSKIEGLRPRQ